MTQTLVKHYTEIESARFGDQAPGTSIRVLISDMKEDAPVYNLRMIEIQPGGHSPDHSHPYEHENFIVEGTGEVMIDGNVYNLSPGTVILVPPGAQHQYRNSGDKPLKFLCGIPVEKLRG
jgi:quercetin dioxygenase-like cupin family protein